MTIPMLWVRTVSSKSRPTGTSRTKPPGLLTRDAHARRRIAQDPALLWKALNVRPHNSGKPITG